MRISPVTLPGGPSPVSGVGARKPGVVDAEAGAPSFGQMVKNAIGEVTELQSQSAKLTTQVATGELEDVHRAMIAGQKAKLALEFTIQVRNKVIEAYQEIMRMQV